MHFWTYVQFAAQDNNKTRLTIVVISWNNYSSERSLTWNFSKVSEKCGYRDNFGGLKQFLPILPRTSEYILFNGSGDWQSACSWKFGLIAFFSQNLIASIKENIYRILKLNLDDLVDISQFLLQWVFWNLPVRYVFGHCMPVPGIWQKYISKIFASWNFIQKGGSS